MINSAKFLVFFGIFVFCFFTPVQEPLSNRTKHMHYSEKGRLKKVAYEFLSTWNTSAELIKPSKNALGQKMKENRQKRKDPNKGTEKLKAAYDAAVMADGTERSFLAETFALPMRNELYKKGHELAPADIYTAQYVIKYTLGVPRFNHGELNVDDLQSMEHELQNLILSYPDNAAHNQEVDGHVIDIFREEANAYFESFVAANKAQYLQEQSGKKSGAAPNLTSMNCGEKYEYLKAKGIMH